LFYHSILNSNGVIHIEIAGANVEAMGMANNKISDFFCVGTSGPTVDGRELRAQWLQDCGKTYSRSEYQGFIWYEHWRWGGNFGQVVEAKVEKQEDGRYKHYNRLQPSDQLLELNREGQKVFSSMEIVPNFAQSGMAYQVGLGITDSPASLGTDQLKLFTNLEQPLNSNPEFKQFCNGVLCERIDKFQQRIPDEAAFKGKDVKIFIGEQWPDLEFSAKRTVFDLGAKLLGFKQSSHHANNNQGQEADIDMDKTELTQLFQSEMGKALEPLNNKFSDVDKRLKSLEGKQSDGNADDSHDHSSNTDAGGDDATPAVFATQKSVDEVSKKMDKFMQLLEKTPSGDYQHEDFTDSNDQSDQYTY